MARLFVPNFDFEHRLAAAGRTPSRRLQRINAELASAWVAVAEDGDAILLPEPIDGGFWAALAEAGLPRVRGVRDVSESSGYVWTPWGWSAEMRKQVASHAILNVPPLDAVRAVNSRRFSARLETEWHVGLCGAVAATSVEEVRQGVWNCDRTGNGWVIKAEFSMSGRERLLGRGELELAQQRWVERRLEADGVVFVEPWVTCVAEAGLQFEISPAQQVTFLGVTEMLSTRQGTYAGSRFTTTDHADDWSAAIAVATRAVEQIAEHGYFGPVGIDAMRYRQADGTIGCRPLQDVNTRWTMGRLALGWRRLFPAVTEGFWWHGTDADFAASRYYEECGISPAELGQWIVIRTSPERVGTQPAWLASALVVNQSG